MKIIKPIIGLVILLASTISFAQITISGQIKDEFTEEPLPEVSVYLPDLKKSVLTNESGYYTIENLRKGSYILEIKAFGYKSIIRKIELTESTVIDFSMEETVTELNQVVITGVSRSTELKRNPVIVKTLDNSTLSRGNAMNLIDGLKAVPGISEITTGPNISKPVIRGLGYNRVITLNNGIKQEGQQWGDEHGIEIDEYSVDRVEIIKGPGSLMYGSDGIAGVLNFLPPKAPVNGDIKTRLLTNYQSNNNLIGTSVVNSGNLNGFQWSGRISNKLAGNYENKYDGKVYNSGFRELNGDLTLGISKSWGHSYLTVSSYNSKLGIVEGERDENGNFIYENADGEEITATNEDLRSYAIGTPYQKVNHLSVASNNYFILDKGSINADFGFQNNRRREFEEAENPDEAGLSLTLNTLNYNVRYNFQRLNNWEISAGISGMQQTNKNKGEEFLIPDYNLFDIGGFVFAQKSFEQLTLAGGFRFDNRNMNTKQLYLNEDEEPVAIPDEGSELKFAHFNKNYNGFSGSVGLSYQLTKNSTLKLNLSQGFRAPNVAELASNGKHEGTFRYEIGNPNLKSEISRQIDLAYFLDSEHITLEITPFVNFINHYSFLEKLKDENGNDVIPDPMEPSPAFSYTSGQATLSGGEIYLDFHPHPLDWLHIENSFSYVSAIQKNKSDSMKYLPFIPAPHYRGGIKAEFKNLNKTISNFYIQMNADHYFAQNHVYTAFDTETATPSYTLLSAGLGASFSWFDKKDFISLYLSGNNLTNLAYQSHLSRLKYADQNPATGRRGVFDMGRNISFKMVMRF